MGDFPLNPAVVGDRPLPCLITRVKDIEDVSNQDQVYHGICFHRSHETNRGFTNQAVHGQFWQRKAICFRLPGSPPVSRHDPCAIFAMYNCVKPDDQPFTIGTFIFLFFTES